MLVSEGLAKVWEGRRTYIVEDDGALTKVGETPRRPYSGMVLAINRPSLGHLIKVALDAVSPLQHQSEVRFLG